MAQAVFTVSLIILTFRTVQANASMAAETKRMAEETEKMARETEKMSATALKQLLSSTQPVILVRFRGDSVKNKIWINVHNYGGPASDVTFSFDPPLINSSGDDKGLTPMFASGVPVVPPEWDQEVKFDEYNKYFDNLFYHRGRNFLFKVTISASDPFTSTPLPPTTMNMDLRYVTPQALLGDWDPRSGFVSETTLDAHSTLESEQVRLESTLSSFSYDEVERVPLGHWVVQIREAFRKNNWTLAEGRHGNWYRVVATKNSGPIEGTSVGASGVTEKAALAFTLRQALDLDSDVNQT